MPLEDNKPEGLVSSERPHESESQFILRMPSLPAASLRCAVGQRVMNLKDRLSIQVEPDMRRGTVRFDDWVLPAKVVDLPTIIESHKTFDSKNFYKTANISQIMVCKEDTDESNRKNEESENTLQKKLKDRRFLYPHGITPPLKNVRKKRFRKILKKNYLEFPEIEKEVKRLFRTDNEAIHVRYEVVNADEEVNADVAKSNDAFSLGIGESNTSFNAGEQDIFGDVSSSDEDDTRVPDSGDDSRLSSSIKDPIITEFSNGMFTDMPSDPLANTFSHNYEMKTMETSEPVDAIDAAALEEETVATFALERGAENDHLVERLSEIESEIQSLQTQRLDQQIEMDNIENISLKQRFQSQINELKAQEVSKRREYDQLMTLLSYQ